MTSSIPWTVRGATGTTVSTVLPRVVRTFQEFALVDSYTGDIDPTYWAIHSSRAAFGEGWAARFCVGMLTYYHTGTAAKAADYQGEDFWGFLRHVYDTAPRAAERRHFRGEVGKLALDSMEHLSPDPDQFFTKFIPSYPAIRAACELRLRQFGPYFQLKVADYMDRCLGIPVITMWDLASHLPTFPERAAKLRYPSLTTSSAFTACYNDLQEEGILAAPLFEREIGPAEVETILCDWKRAKSGSSWIGADVYDKRIAFRGYGDKAEAMMDMMPPLVDRQTFELRL